MFLTARPVLLSVAVWATLGWTEEGGDWVSAIKIQLLFSFLHLVSFSISPPPDLTQSYSSSSPPSSTCVLSIDPLWQKIKGRLCCVNITGSRCIILRLAERERMRRIDKSMDPVSEPLGRLFWLKSESEFTELLALNNKKYQQFVERI